jgi:hypothetical protein
MVFNLGKYLLKHYFIFKAARVKSSKAPSDSCLLFYGKYEETSHVKEH